MSASKIGKSYNAESAWSSLGTPKGWQEYYDQVSQAPKYKRVFQSIQDPGFRPPSSTGYDYSIDLMQRMKTPSVGFINPQMLVNNIYAGINNYPQQIFNSALAGKYTELF